MERGAGAGVRRSRRLEAVREDAALRAGVPAPFERVVDEMPRALGDIPAGLGAVVLGAREQGEWLVDDARITVVSATGSTAMGRAVRRDRGALRPVTSSNWAATTP